MAKLKRLVGGEETVCLLKCPGCGRHHRVRVEGEGDTWYWNGDEERPTFTPSVHVMPGSKAECHFHVEDGRIQFLPDCYHELAGETVELPEI